MLPSTLRGTLKDTNSEESDMVGKGEQEDDDEN